MKAEWATINIFSTEFNSNEAENCRKVDYAGPKVWHASSLEFNVILIYLWYGIVYSRLYLMSSWLFYVFLFNVFGCHWSFWMSSLLCRLCYVVFVKCNAAHNSSMWTYFYFLFVCHMSTSGFDVICTVTSCLKGHLSYS